MRAWYDIREADLANRADEAGVAESVGQVEALIAREVERGVTVSRIFLAGFSQGGAVILAAGLRRSEPLAGLIALSTYVPAAPTAAAALAAGANVQPVFIRHGTPDPVVPFLAGEQSPALPRQYSFLDDWPAYPLPSSGCLAEDSVRCAWCAPRAGGG